jgi:hypothetical protein
MVPPGHYSTNIRSPSHITKPLSEIPNERAPPMFRHELGGHLLNRETVGEFILVDANVFQSSISAEGLASGTWGFSTWLLSLVNMGIQFTVASIGTWSTFASEGRGIKWHTLSTVQTSLETTWVFNLTNTSSLMSINKPLLGEKFHSVRDWCEWWHHLSMERWAEWNKWNRWQRKIFERIGDRWWEASNERERKDLPKFIRFSIRSEDLLFFIEQLNVWTATISIQQRFYSCPSSQRERVTANFYRLKIGTGDKLIDFNRISLKWGRSMIPNAKSDKYWTYLNEIDHWETELFRYSERKPLLCNGQRGGSTSTIFIKLNNLIHLGKNLTVTNQRTTRQSQMILSLLINRDDRRKFPRFNSQHNEWRRYLPMIRVNTNKSQCLIQESYFGRVSTISGRASLYWPSRWINHCSPRWSKQFVCNHDIEDRGGPLSLL